MANIRKNYSIGKKHELLVYIKPYLCSTMHFSVEQHGCLFMLLIHFNVHKELPSDDTQLAAICRLDIKAWLNQRNSVLYVLRSYLGEIPNA